MLTGETMILNNLISEIEMNTFRNGIALLTILSIIGIGCNRNTDTKSGQKDSINDSITLQVSADTIVSDKDKPLTIAMVGDIMMGTTFPKGGNNLTADDGATLFQDAREIFSKVDITAGNLEGTLFDGEGIPKPVRNPQRYFVFRMPERYAKHLVDAGFDFVSVANNHTHDLGDEAFKRTQEVLDEAGIEYAGVSDKKPTTIIERNGRKIGFAAFGFDKGMPHINNFAEISSLVSDLKKETDIVVVSFHGGNEGENYQHVPHRVEGSGDVEKFAHAAIDAGADVVYGQSPHVPRAFELYKDRIIFYSLGNFCTPYRFDLTDVRGLAPIAEVTVNPDGSFKTGQIHSFVQEKGIGPRKDTTNRAAKTMWKLTQDDFPKTPLTMSDDGMITKIE